MTNPQHSSVDDEVLDLMRQHAQWWKTDKESGMPPNEAKDRIMALIEAERVKVRIDELQNVRYQPVRYNVTDTKPIEERIEAYQAQLRKENTPDGK